MSYKIYIDDSLPCEPELLEALTDHVQVIRFPDLNSLYSELISDEDIFVVVAPLSSTIKKTAGIFLAEELDETLIETIFSHMTRVKMLNLFKESIKNLLQNNEYTHFEHENNQVINHWIWFMYQSNQPDFTLVDDLIHRKYIASGKQYTISYDPPKDMSKHEAYVAEFIANRGSDTWTIQSDNLQYVYLSSKLIKDYFDHDFSCGIIFVLKF